MELKRPKHTIVTPVATIGEPIGAGTGEISALGFTESAAHELVDAIINRHLVSVSEDAPCCCIDGRMCLHSLASQTEKPLLGPSLAGGALVTAYAAAELVPGYFMDGDPQTFEARLQAVRHTLVSNPTEKIVIGAHTADSAAPGATGCGASDKFSTIISQPGQQKAVVDSVTSLLLGEHTVDTAAMGFTPANKLQAQTAGYDAQIVTQMIADENIEVLTGKHAELLVVFNYNESTTVDRDELVAETGRQVFVVDMWYIDKLSRAMAAGRPDAVDMENKLRHAMTAFQVSTYLTLCDGTHRPVLLHSAQAA